MPLTEKMSFGVDLVTEAAKAINTLENSPEYEGIKERDKSELRSFVKKHLNALRSVVVQNPDFKNTKNIYLTKISETLTEEINSVSLTMTQESINQIIDCLTSEDDTLITDAVADMFIAEPNVFDAVNAGLCSEFPNSEHDFDAELEKIEHPMFSNAVTEYRKSGNNIYNKIQNLSTQKELDDLKYDVERAERVAPFNEELQKEYVDLSNQLKVRSIYTKGVERDTDLIVQMMEDLCPADGKAYEERLAEIVTYIVKVRGADSKLTLSGVSGNEIYTFADGAKYLSELLTRSELLASCRNDYVASVNFERVAALASEKYYQNGINEYSNRIGGKLNGILQENRRTAEDVDKIKAFFRDCDSSEEITAAYERAFKAIVNRNVVMDGLDVTNLNGTQPEIARVNKYLMRMARRAGVDISQISSHSIIKTCDVATNAENNALEMMQDFNRAINRYQVAGQEMVALTFATDTNSPDYLSAKAKTEGLPRTVDAELMKDAVGIWARLQQIHDHRSFWDKFFHPIRNYRENSTIEKMEGILKRDFGYTDEALQTMLRDALDSVNDPISLEARKREGMPFAIQRVNQAEARQKDRDQILDLKLEWINHFRSLEASDEIVVQQEEIHAAKQNPVPKQEPKQEPKPEPQKVEKKEPEKKKEEPVNDYYRLKNLTDKKFEKYLERATAEERKELEDRYSSHGKKPLDEETKQEIDRKVEVYKNELIQIHVDPDGYIRDFNNRVKDRDADLLERAVIEAFESGDYKNHLKQKYAENEKLRQQRANLSREREDLRVEYYQKGDSMEKYGLDRQNVNSENKSRERLMDQLGFNEQVNDVKQNQISEKKEPAIQKQEIQQQKVEIVEEIDPMQKSN